MMVCASENSKLPPSEQVNRVYVDGVDVTRECFEFDESLGIARCYMRGADGLFIERSGILATEELRGKITVEKGQ